jgi:SnoaL-like domain
VSTQPASIAASENGSGAPTPVERFPIEEFRAAMEARDPDRALAHFTDDCLLRPVGTDHVRFQGKPTARRLLQAVLSIPDEWEYTEEIATGDFLAIMVKIRFGGLDMEAVDFLRINEEGKAYEMFLLARPQLAVAIFTGRVAMAFAEDAGWFRRNLLKLLVVPLNVSQFIAGRVGAWLIRPAVPGHTRSPL